VALQVTHLPWRAPCLSQFIKETALPRQPHTCNRRVVLRAFAGSAPVTDRRRSQIPRDANAGEGSEGDPQILPNDEYQERACSASQPVLTHLTEISSGVRVLTLTTACDLTFKTSSVPTGQTRIATKPRVACGVMEPAPCGNNKSGCPSPNGRKNLNQVVKSIVIRS